MNEFTQLMRHGSQSDVHKERIYQYVDNLHIKEGQEYQCVIKQYKKSKTLEQLGYYWGVIIPVVCEWEGFTCKGKSEDCLKTEESADYFLKKNCCAPIYMEIMGETYEIKPSIAKMKVNKMSEYIDACVTFLGVQGQVVPQPVWNNK